MSPTDDDRMRRLLDDAVAGVEPRHGLDAIRSRTTSRSRSRRPWARPAAGAALAVAATVAAVVALGGLGGLPGTTDRPAPAASAPVRSPGIVAVYYLGDTGAGPRLFREMRLGPPTGDRALDALQQAVDGDALDPDYRSAWPAGTRVDRVASSPSAITVDLRGADLDGRPAGMSADEARVSVQQLVLTAQAATGHSRLPLAFRLDGSPAGALLGTPTAGPVPSASPDDVLAPVSISAPAATEGRSPRLSSPVTVKGEAAAFEANVQWELMRGDVVVKKGFATARECCTLSPYSFRFSAAPGEYTLVVHDEDMSGGEGVPRSSDSKDITVR